MHQALPLTRLVQNLDQYESQLDSHQPSEKPSFPTLRLCPKPMAKRQANETAASYEDAELSSHAPTSLYPTKNCSIHQNAHKRLHLSPPIDMKTSTSRTGQEDVNNYKSIDKQSLADITSPDSRSLGSLEVPLEGACKLRQASQDLEIESKINCTKERDRAQGACKHLIKTVLDLPVFVTIEGFRVASYLIDGEPHLCLPQLLQFIQRISPLDKVIDKFEESRTNFVSATPKQVEGFIKAIVLPQDASSCPLIKLSYAERVCQALKDQQSKGNMKEASSPSPKTDFNSKDNLESSHRKSTTEDRVHDAAEEISDIRVGNSPNDLSSEQSFSTSSGRNSQRSTNDPGEQKSSLQEAVESRTRAPIANATSLSSPAQEKEITRGRETASSGNNSREQNAPISDPTGNDANREKFFETEAQDTILNLARSVTSTLMIQVYHRCFGKCVGLYYPALLKNSDSDCIQCSSCHKFLSPRRFIGHTHGAREVNVCHWGFNPCHWPSYIRLSRKQSMNNLDDDELLVQFNQLKAVRNEAPDMTTDLTCSNEQDLKSLCHINGVACDTNLAKKGASQPHLNVAHSKDPIMRDPQSSLAASASAIQTTSEEHPNFPSSCTEQSPLKAIGLPGYNFLGLDKMPPIWITEQSKTSSRKTSLPARMSFNSGREDALKSSSTNLFYGSVLSNLPSTSSGYSSSAAPLTMDPTNTAQTHLELLRLYGDTNIAHLVGGKGSSSFSQIATDRLIKQDLFVSTSLSNYLDTKGVSSKMNQEIVSVTLNLINKARTLL